MATGRVTAGKVILEGEPLSEGSVVTVLAQEDDEAFDVTPEEIKNSAQESIGPGFSEQP
ncbi:MAG: hypothetical protein ACRD2X_12520 [Vicinamibacteraceae bacterium]